MNNAPKPDNSKQRIQHRPAGICAAGVLGAVVLLVGFELEAQAGIAAIIAAVLGVLCFFLPKSPFKRILSLLIAGFILSCGAVMFSEYTVSRHVMQYANHSYRYRVSGITLEDGEIYDDRTRILLRVDTVDGEAVRAFRTYTYLENAGEVGVGCRVTLDMRFEKPPTEQNGFDARHYYRAKGVCLMGKAAQNVMVEELTDTPFWLAPTMWSKALGQRLHTLTNDEHAAVLRSLLLGDTSGIDPAYEKALRRCGLSHIMAVSGMNVAFIANFFVLMFRRRWGTALSIPALVIFALMVGADASVVRAVIMQLIFLGAYAVRRENDSLNALLVTLGLMLLYNPYYLYDAGMWLSFASTLGLMLTGLRMRTALERPFKRLPGLMRRVVGLFTGALAATLSTFVLILPLQLYYFRSFSLVAPLANMLLLWMAEGSFFMGMVGVLLSYLWMPLGKLCMILAWPLLECQLIFVPKLAGLPFTMIPSDCWTLIGVGIAYGFGMLHVLCRPKYSLRVTAAAASICLCCVILCAQVDRMMSVTVACLDTRGGQATVVHDGENCAVINCGGTTGADETIAYLESQGIGEIDLLVLTDGKRSSVSGAGELSKQFPVERLVYAADAAPVLTEIRAESLMEAGSDARLDAAHFSLQLRAADTDGFDADRLSAQLTVDDRRFLLPGSVSADALAAHAGEHDAVLASDYYADHVLPDGLLRKGGLWLMPSWEGADAAIVADAWEQGYVPVDLYEQGHVIFTKR